MGMAANGPTRIWGINLARISGPEKQTARGPSHPYAEQNQMKKRTTRITVETDWVLILKRGRSPRAAATSAPPAVDDQSQRSKAGATCTGPNTAGKLILKPPAIGGRK